MAEATDLKSVQCAFDPHHRHMGKHKSKVDAALQRRQAKWRDETGTRKPGSQNRKKGYGRREPRR